MRQTPASAGIWGNCQFFVNQDLTECDWWVVYDGLSRPEATCCPRQHTILITGEPASVRTYDSNFLRQFATVVTCQSQIIHPGVLLQNTAQPWHVGVDRDTETATLRFEDLCRLGSTPKSKLVSLACSSKTITEGHRQRVRFIEKLKAYFGADIDVYGRGFTPIADKWDAIAPYKYHIALENSRYPHYWTEKLADAFLAGAFPIYHGAPNLNEYFPSGSFAEIDIADPDLALSITQQTIHNDLFDRSLKQIAAARNLVLTKYNLFAMLAEICSCEASFAERIELYPEKTAMGSAVLLRSAMRSAKSLWKKIAPASASKAIGK